MTRSDLVSALAALLSFAGVTVGVIASGRANRRSARNQESGVNLDWVRQARAEAEAAETKLLRAETALDQASNRAERSERRLEAMEKTLTDVQRGAAQLADWIWVVIDAAHDPAIDADRLREIVNGGPPGFRNRR
jgi:thymidylate kinase